MGKPIFRDTGDPVDDSRRVIRFFANYGRPLSAADFRAILMSAPLGEALRITQAMTKMSTLGEILLAEGDTRIDRSLSGACDITRQMLMETLMDDHAPTSSLRKAASDTVEVNAAYILYAAGAFVAGDIYDILETSLALNAALSPGNQRERAALIDITKARADCQELISREKLGMLDLVECGEHESPGFHFTTS